MSNVNKLALIPVIVSVSLLPIVRLWALNQHGAESLDMVYLLLPPL